MLYKLAMYAKGGHFKAHADTTHGDAHHGTLLVGLGGDYEGGALVLHRYSADLEPIKSRIDPGEWVAFYTDVEHEVEPVTKGWRATVQFDIFLEDAEPVRKHTVACVPANLEPKPTTNEPEEKTSGGGSIGEDDTASVDSLLDQEPTRWQDLGAYD